MVGQEIEPDIIRFEQAWALDRQWVRSTFTISCPADFHGEITIIGAGHGDIERSAFVPKNLLIDKGDEVTVFGKLQVIAHPPHWVNGQFVKAWHEIRISAAAQP